MMVCTIISWHWECVTIAQLQWKHMGDSGEVLSLWLKLTDNSYADLMLIRIAIIIALLGTKTMQCQVRRTTEQAPFQREGRWSECAVLSWLQYFWREHVVIILFLIHTMTQNKTLNSSVSLLQESSVWSVFISTLNLTKDSWQVLLSIC